MSLIQKKPMYADINYAQYIPCSCDICKKNIKDMEFYADSIVPGSHRWGFFCQECIEAKQLSFWSETGKLYRKQKNANPNMEWLLVAGHSELPNDCLQEFYDEYGNLYEYMNEDFEYFTLCEGKKFRTADIIEKIRNFRKPT